MKLTRDWILKILKRGCRGFVNPDKSTIEGSVFNIDPSHSENMGFYSVEKVHAAVLTLTLNRSLGIISPSDELLTLILRDAKIIQD